MTRKEMKLKELKEVRGCQLERLGDFFTISDDTELINAADGTVYNPDLLVYYLQGDYFYLEDGTRIYPSNWKKSK